MTRQGGILRPLQFGCTFCSSSALTLSGNAPNDICTSALGWRSAARVLLHFGTSITVSYRVQAVQGVWHALWQMSSRQLHGHACLSKRCCHTHTAHAIRRRWPHAARQSAFVWEKEGECCCSLMHGWPQHNCNDLLRLLFLPRWPSHLHPACDSINYISAYSSDCLWGPQSAHAYHSASDSHSADTVHWQWTWVAEFK